MTRNYFQTFTSKPIGNARESCQLLLALSVDSRDNVDQLVQTAAGAGGTADPREPMDMGFMYNRAFEDPDGYVFELLWMNPDATMDGTPTGEA